MRLVTVRAFVWISWLFGSVLLAAESTPLAHVADPSHLLSRDTPAAKALDDKLAAFERTSGIRILLEFEAKSPPTEEDKLPGAYMHARAIRRGTAERGVLAVYFAEEDDWRVWIGDALAGSFTGHEGTAAELTKSGAIHEAKEALFAAAQTRADAAIATRLKTGSASGEVSAPERVKLHADAIIDGLTEKLGRK